MRVISGSSRGKKLLAPSGLDTRPTTDRVKESIFNLLMPYIPAKNVLDLFAGSGSLGIEALSRGCESAVFVENDKAAQNIVKKNLELVRKTECSQVVSSDAFHFLAHTNKVFDLIFLDPPYSTGMLGRAINQIDLYNLLAEDGIILAESETGGEEPPDEHFEIIKRAKYGKTTVFVLRHCR